MEIIFLFLYSFLISRLYKYIDKSSAWPVESRFIRSNPQVQKVKSGWGNGVWEGGWWLVQPNDSKGEYIWGSWDLRVNLALRETLWCHNQGCAWPLLESTVATGPGVSTVQHIRWCIWTIPLSRCTLLASYSPASPYDGGGEEGRRMILNEKISTSSLNSKLRYISLFVARHSPYCWISWLTNTILYGEGGFVLYPSDKLDRNQEKGEIGFLGHVHSGRKKVELKS